MPRKSRPPTSRLSEAPGGARGARHKALDETSDESPTVVKRESAVRPAHPITNFVPKLTIEVRGGSDSPGRCVVHQGDSCRIGTHSSNDLILRDPSVSRFHCKLTHDNGIWHLQDSGSLNGTKLDGVRIRDADLAVEGTIWVGDTRVYVRPAEGTDEVSLPIAQSFGALWGTSVTMRKLFALLEKVAASEINVLIEGESGTGKELVAAELVARGPRADGPFVIVDCSAIAPNLVESELFGHVRGAFTGAERDRLGAFEMAAGGTVFLDEIGELPVELQPKLLRAIEAREIRRVGETKARKVNVRVIAATNRDLEREVNKGRFREDLYFRLAVVSVRVPPLRERIEDLPILIRRFLAGCSVTDNSDLFSPRVLAELSTHDWPGNVRELRNYVERAIVLREPVFAPQRSLFAPGAVDTRLPFKLAKDAVVDAFERNYVTALLEEAAGNVSKAARHGGMDRMYLHRLIQKHGLRSTPLRDPDDGS